MLIIYLECAILSNRKKKMAVKSKSGKKWKMMYYFVVHFFTRNRIKKIKTTTAIAQKIKLVLEEEFSRPADTRNHSRHKGSESSFSFNGLSVFLMES